MASKEATAYIIWSETERRQVNQGILVTSEEADEWIARSGSKNPVDQGLVKVKVPYK